jgi:hypothetical protein
MTDVTQILSQIEQGDPNAAELLLPLVFEELLAAAKLDEEKPGQTLQATAMVHDAYARLVERTNLRKVPTAVACGRDLWRGRSLSRHPGRLLANSFLPNRIVCVSSRSHSLVNSLGTHTTSGVVV